MATKKKAKKATKHKIPASIAAALDREPGKGSDEANFRAMLDHAAQAWQMTASDKGWHGYSVGMPILVWFDPDGACLGIADMRLK